MVDTYCTGNSAKVCPFDKITHRFEKSLSHFLIGTMERKITARPPDISFMQNDLVMAKEIELYLLKGGNQLFAVS